MELWRWNGNGNGNGGAPPVTAKDIEAIMAKAPAGPVQTIRIEQAPLNLTAAAPAPAPKKEEPPFTM